MLRVMDTTTSARAVRPYTNHRRAAQAAQTRTLILDGLLRVMARGTAELSVPAVAREAGVSIRTVYRNFPTKRELLAALGAHISDQTGTFPHPYPRNLAELVALVHRDFPKIDALGDVVNAAYASGLGQELRRTYDIPEKQDAVAEALSQVAATLDGHERDQLVQVVSMLFSRYTLWRLKDEFGLTADQAADTVAWAIAMLARGVQCSDPPAIA